MYIGMNLLLENVDNQVVGLCDVSGCYAEQFTVYTWKSK